MLGPTIATLPTNELRDTSFLLSKTEDIFNEFFHLLPSTKTCVSVTMVVTLHSAPISLAYEIRGTSFLSKTEAIFNEFFQPLSSKKLDSL